MKHCDCDASYRVGLGGLLLQADGNGRAGAWTLSFDATAYPDATALNEPCSRNDAYWQIVVDPDANRPAFEDRPEERQARSGRKYLKLWARYLKAVRLIRPRPAN